MKTLTLYFILSLVSWSFAFAQGPSSCINLSGKFIETVERVDYPDGTFENDPPLDKAPFEIGEADDCIEATFTSIDSATAKPVLRVIKFDGIPGNPVPFNNATGNGTTGDLTFYSVGSLTDTGFKIDSACSLNNGPIKFTGVNTAYSFDSSGNLITIVSYSDGVKITHFFKSLISAR